MSWPALGSLLLLTPPLVGCEEDPYQVNGDGPTTETAAIDLLNQVGDPAMPAIDFCVKGPMSWVGPIVHYNMEQVEGLPFQEGTGPMTLPAGSYIVRVVDPMTALCVPPLGGIDVPLELVAGRYYLGTVSGYVEPDARQDPLSVDFQEQ